MRWRRYLCLLEIILVLDDLLLVTMNILKMGGWVVGDGSELGKSHAHGPISSTLHSNQCTWQMYTPRLKLSSRHEHTCKITKKRALSKPESEMVEELHRKLRFPIFLVTFGAAFGQKWKLVDENGIGEIISGQIGRSLQVLFAKRI